MFTRRCILGVTGASFFIQSANVGAKDFSTKQTNHEKKEIPMEVERAFVRIKEGLIHYRHAGHESDHGPLPLYMMHAGPGSSKGIANLVANLGASRKCIAADTLGFGESVPPSPEEPDLIYYADSVIRILDQLKLEKVDLYGSHTGANIGLEIAIARPDRVRKLIFDGVALFDPELAKDMLKNYAPKIKPQENGEHLIWAWNFMRDMGVYFPHYMKDAEHYLGKKPWSANILHNGVMEVMKAMDHYHKGYNAVFRHKTHERLPLLTTPTFCMAHEADPLHVSVEEAAELVNGAQHKVLPFSAGDKERTEAIVNFLDT